ncbi:hypothetical protein GCM10010922_24810 [Microbacterium sorbitolivorans]|nr:hypothetical protein GCM10010922_24810 [Microbacterium sorbitolivorans]
MYAGAVTRHLDKTSRIELDSSDLRIARDEWVRAAFAFTETVENAFAGSGVTGKLGSFEGPSWAEFSVATDNLLYACDEENA